MICLDLAIHTVWLIWGFFVVVFLFLFLLTAWCIVYQQKHFGIYNLLEFSWTIFRPPQNWKSKCGMDTCIPLAKYANPLLLCYPVRNDENSHFQNLWIVDLENIKDHLVLISYVLLWTNTAERQNQNKTNLLLSFINICCDIELAQQSFALIFWIESFGSETY